MSRLLQLTQASNGQAISIDLDNCAYYYPCEGGTAFRLSDHRIIIVSEFTEHVASAINELNSNWPNGSSEVSKTL